MVLSALVLINCLKASEAGSTSNRRIVKEKMIVPETAIDTALTEKIIDVLLKPVYDTMSLKPVPEMDKELHFPVQASKRFTLHNMTFAAMAVENQYPFAGDIGRAL